MRMLTPDADLIAVLRQMNPWWQGKRVPDLPTWRRAAFAELSRWLRNPPAPRAVLMSGARQIGKTTLFSQAIEDLIADGVPAANILYVTFDHPLLKLAGLDAVIRLWRSSESAQPGLEYLFIDEIQFMRDWQTWLKHQVDFHKDRRIAVTGSATPLVAEGQESGVGRWHTIRLATLSFYEYLRIKKESEPELPDVRSLQQLFTWSTADFTKASAIAEPLAGKFHEYLQRGGFPQCALAPTITWAQKLLREDIVDKVLKRDMTALFGVRRVVEMEHTFLYLCLHDGGILDIPELCKNLAVNKQTALNFIELLSATHLIHKLPPLGYGKEVLRGRHKIYLADAAIAASVLARGTMLMEDDTALGHAVETAFFKHVVTRYYRANLRFSYWRSKQGHEVDMVAEVNHRLIPFEVKYRSQHTGLRDLPGLIELCVDKRISRAYVITRSMDDFSVLPLERDGHHIELLKIPAPLACYWLGRSELFETASDTTLT